MRPPNVRRRRHRRHDNTLVHAFVSNNVVRVAQRMQLRRSSPVRKTASLVVSQVTNEEVSGRVSLINLRSHKDNWQHG